MQREAKEVLALLPSTQHPFWVGMRPLLVRLFTDPRMEIVWDWWLREGKGKWQHNVLDDGASPHELDVSALGLFCACIRGAIVKPSWVLELSPSKRRKKLKRVNGLAKALQQELRGTIFDADKDNAPNLEEVWAGAQLVQRLEAVVRWAKEDAGADKTWHNKTEPYFRRSFYRVSSAYAVEIPPEVLAAIAEVALGLPERKTGDPVDDMRRQLARDKKTIWASQRGQKR